MEQIVTKLERLTIKAIKNWCIEQDMKPTEPLCHIYPRAYVLGRPAGSCLLVALPLVDAEPQVKKMRKAMTSDGSTIIHLFDSILKAGDWCSVAYVCFNGRQERVAVKAVEYE